MPWSTIRKATEKDYEKLEQRAQAFAIRHDIEVLDGDTAVQSVEYHVFDYSDEETKHLRPLWRRIVQRALGDGAEGIAYGHVGFHVQ